MRLEIRQKVGVITGVGIVFGTVDFIYPYGEIRVAGSWNGDFCEAPAQYVFPVWEGQYTKEDALRLSKLAKSLGNRVLETDIMNLHKLNLVYYQGVLRELNRLRKELSRDVADARAVEVIDKFLDWAAHGFQTTKEART